MPCPSRNRLAPTTPALAAAALAMFVAAVGAAPAQQSIDVRISLTRAEAVRISDLDDVLLGTYAATDKLGASEVSGADTQCVFSSTGAFQVELISRNASTVGGNWLVLASGAGDTMRYTLSLRARASTGGAWGGWQEYQKNDFMGLSGPGSSSLDCTDQPAGVNLEFSAAVQTGQFNGAQPGVYQDVLTFVVSPE